MTPTDTSLRGGCHCGLLRVAFRTKHDPAELAPRACDCSFCRSHGAAYVSDPEGKLSITQARAGAMREYQQGSGAARFLLCSECGVLVAVIHRHAGGIHGAVNAACLDAHDAFAATVAVSPQALAPEERMSRWLAMWVPDVVLAVVGDATPTRDVDSAGHAPAESVQQARSPRELAAALDELWSPRVIGELDDAYIKVAKVHGTFGWHRHADEDELFFVLAGRLRIEMRDRHVALGEGGMFIVPRGVEHNPVAEHECLVMLVERKSTLHSGDVVNEHTRSIEEQLRPS